MEWNVVYFLNRCGFGRGARGRARGLVRTEAQIMSDHARIGLRTPSEIELAILQHGACGALFGRRSRNRVKLGVRAFAVFQISFFYFSTDIQLNFSIETMVSTEHLVDLDK